MAVKRLIETFVPENYQIFLDVDRQTREFSGVTVIKGEAKVETFDIHQKDLKISSVKVDDQIVDFSVSADEETLTIKAGKTGHLSVEIAYTAPLTDNMMGIYPSYYEIEGVKKMLIGTQFESHFARQAFPCVDEPEAKATFDLSVKFDEEPEDSIISNMPEKSCEKGVHIFETTVRMSPYLLAFVFGSLQCKTAKTKSGVTVGAYSTRAHKLEALNFPLEIAVSAIEFYEDYYQTPYPLAHSWHVALPDFSAGAMENWGCITYREVCMLVDPDNATVASKQYVATVICHELAHQWFGNLVTMRWWDDLWLNESFANNMEYVSVDAIHPEWKIWESFNAVEARMALDRDATDGVQSVHVEVNHPDEINTLFDPAIVYAKGARLMVMLRYWLGDKVFAKGLHQYFETNKYGNTTGDDLWAALSEASGKDVAEFMHSWINQPGYPVLNVSYEADTLILEQEQFFIGAHEVSDRLWQIPLNSNYSELPDVLTDRRLEIRDFKLSAGKPLLFNAQNMAHYLVNYDEKLLKTLLENLGELDDISRFQILQDRKYLAKAERISFDEVIRLLPYYAQEDSYIVELAVSQLLAELELFIDEDTPADKTFKQLTEKLFNTSYARLGWKKGEGESSDDESLRTLALTKMVTAENKDAVEKARTIFAQHKEAPETISADSRPIVLRNEIHVTNSTELVDDFIARYKKSALQEYKRELESAISYIKDDATIKQILERFKDADTFKPQDLPFLYLSLITKDYSQDAAWAWLQADWDWLKEKLGGDMSFDYFVVYTARAFKTAEKLQAFKDFFEPRLDELGLKRDILMGISTIEARVTLINSQKAAVLSALTAVEEVLH